MKTMVVLDERLVRVLIEATEKVDAEMVMTREHQADLVEARRQLEVGLAVLAKAREEARG